MYCELRKPGIAAEPRLPATPHPFARLMLISTAMYMTLPNQAFAQALEVPPGESSIDENGVDLSSGDVVIERTDIDIGGFEGLVEARHYGKSYGDNHTIYVITDYPTRQVVISGNRTNYEPQTDPNEWRSADGGVLKLDISNGYALTGYTLTTSSGEVYKLTQEVSIRCPGSLDVCNNARLTTQIIQPNGRTIDLKYGQNSYCALDEGYSCLIMASLARLEEVSDNTGRALRFFYESNVADGYYYYSNWENLIRASALNRANAYCNPYPDLCSTAAIETVTYGTTYSSPNTIRTSTDAANRTTYYTYNGYGRLISVQPPGYSSPAVTYSYYSGTPNNGRVSQVTANGVTTSYSYAENGAAGEFTATKTHGGASESFVFNLSGDRRLKRAIDALGKQRSFTYDTLGRLALVTQPEGDNVAVTRDGRGNVTLVTRNPKPGSGASAITSSASFDSSCVVATKCNKPNYVIDERGSRTDFTYDATHGGITRVQLPAPTAGQPRPEINYGYQPQYAKERNSSGQLISLPSSILKLTQVTRCATAATCPNTSAETKIAYEYNSSNLQLTKSTVSSGDGLIVAPTAHAYDDANNLVSSDRPLAGSDDTEHFIYDVLNRRRGEIGADPDGAGAKPRRAKRYTYDVAGRVWKIELGTVSGVTGSALDAMTVSQTVDVTFDAIGNKVKEALSSGGTTHAVLQFSYDVAGRLSCVAERMNPAVFPSLPASACTLGTQGSYGPDRITKYGYDGNDRQVLVQTGYASSDQTNAMVVSYTANGKPAYVVDAETNLTTYEYDGHDRLSKTSFPNTTKGAGTSSTSDNEVLTYDAAGNVLTRKPRGTASVFTFTYDNLNRLTAKDIPGTSIDISYTYDLLGHLTSANQTGNNLGFTYDALGRNLTQTGPRGTVTSTYDQAGRRTRLTYADSGLYVDYDYLVTGETTKIRENGATSGIGVLATFGYDNLGRRTSLTFGNGALQTYEYDPVSRPSGLKIDLGGTADDLVIGKVGASGTAIAYNPASQITSLLRSQDAYAWTSAAVVNRDYTSNGLNQYTASGSVTPTYDPRGNLTSAGTTTYGYSFENMLTSATGATSATLSYDPGLRLYQVTSGATTTRFGYDGLDLIAEYDGSNALLRRYVHGPGIDQPLVQYEGSGTATRRFLHADERGSIIAVSDASGNAFAKNSFDEYGIPQTDGSGNSVNYGRFQYTGQVWLPELGIYHYKARMYSPTLGRFLQTDPIGYGDGMNIYAYVGNDPVNKVDPLGLQDDGAVIPVCSTGVRNPFGECVSDWFREIQIGINLEGYFSAFNDSHVASNYVFAYAALAPQIGHDYRISTKVCRRPLTDAERRDLISRFTVPNSNAGLRSGEGYHVVDYGGAIGGVVYTTYSSDGFAGRNVTTPIHTFVGTIDQSVVNRGGAAYLNTHGYGSAGDNWFGRARDDLNDSMGEVVFNSLGSKAAMYAAAYYRGC